MAGKRTLGRPLTRTCYTDKMKVGEAGWHKEGHLVILVERTARGFRRLRILQTRETDYGSLGWWDKKSILKGIFQIGPGTLLLTDKRVRALETELGLTCKQQIHKVDKK